MRHVLFACTAAALVATAAASATPALGATPHLPGSLAGVTARPGPRVGEITLNWTQDGSYTTAFRLETALTPFSTNPTSSLPRQGRDHHVLNLSSHLRTLTLSAAAVAADGAPVASGNHLYYRMAALNTASDGTTAVRNDGFLQAVLPRPQAPVTGGVNLRVASFNVRTAHPAEQDGQTWLQRGPGVAKSIAQHNPDLVALQELGPGRADGQPIPVAGAPRQTDSLLTYLRQVGAAKYKLVRTTSYVEPGTPTATQGARILYDSTRFTLLTSCPDLTGTRTYSSSCIIQLPILSTDGEEHRGHAAYGEFRERSTGQRLFFVSAHLDSRHSTTTSTEVAYNALRAKAAQVIAARIAQLNTRHEPVVIGGDFNSWQSNRIGIGGHDALVHAGYYDTSAAVTRVNFQYTTMNQFKLTLPVASQGVGVRLDMLFTEGAAGAFRFENVMKVTDAARPSDHNMITADVSLPAAARPSWPSISVTTRGTRRTSPTQP